MRFITFGLIGLFCLVSQPVVCAERIDSTGVYKLYFTRHTEKIRSENRDPGLTTLGELRAESLAAFLANKNIAAVYSTDYKRTRLTAAPTARQQKLIIKFYDPSDLPELIEILKSNRQNALVVGHSNTTPMAVRLVGGEALSIDEDEYGQLFVVAIGLNRVQTKVHTVGLSLAE